MTDALSEERLNLIEEAFVYSDHPTAVVAVIVDLVAEVRRLQVECGLLTQRIEAARNIERPIRIDPDLGWDKCITAVRAVLSSGGET